MHATANLRDRLEIAEEENRQLRELLEPEAFLPPEFGLSATESRIVELLVRRSPTVVSKQRLYDVIYFGVDDPPEPKVLDVLICKIRSKLKSFGLDLKTKWGDGFWIDRATAARLREPPTLPIAAATDPEPLATAEPIFVPQDAVDMAADKEPVMSSAVMLDASVEMLGDKVVCSGSIRSEAEMDAFVRRLWCAAEGVWPTPKKEEDEEQPEQPLHNQETRQSGDLTPLQQGVLELSRSEPELPAREVSLRLGCSYQTVLNARAKLEKIGLLTAA